MDFPFPSPVPPRAASLSSSSQSQSKSQSQSQSQTRSSVFSFAAASDDGHTRLHQFSDTPAVGFPLAVSPAHSPLYQVKKKLLTLQAELDRSSQVCVCACASVCACVSASVSVCMCQCVPFVTRLTSSLSVHPLRCPTRQDLIFQNQSLADVTSKYDRDHRELLRIQAQLGSVTGERDEALDLCEKFGRELKDLRDTMVRERDHLTQKYKTYKKRAAAQAQSTQRTLQEFHQHKV
jgi:hypothetical protein